MLTIKTYLSPSSVHGLGLYAAEDIPAQTIIWQFHPFIDNLLTPRDFFETCKGLDEPTLNHMLNATYKRNGHYFYLTDNARFINHSPETSNIGFVDDFSEIALRDIKYGEELLENYTLSYDTNDFFFSELLNPDPYHYLLREGEYCNA